MQPNHSRTRSMIIFAAVAALALAVCVGGAMLGKFSPMSGKSPNDGFPTENIGSASLAEWRVCYTDAEWGKAAAEALARQLTEQTGMSLSVLPLSEAAAEEERENNMILLGYAPEDDYFALLGELGQNGWRMTGSDRQITLTAFSAEGAAGAADALCRELTQIWNGKVLNPSALRSGFCIARTGDEASAALLESRLPLRFSEDGSFKMMLFSDISAGVVLSPYTVKALDALLEAEMPNLVLLCGGVANDFATRAELAAYLTELVAPLETRGIPWAYLSDGAELLPRSVTDEVYAEFAHCVAKPGDSYLLPIYAGDEAKFGVWMMSLPENDAEAGAGNYPPAQLAEFVSMSAAVSASAGGTLPSIMALALPLPEFAQAAASPTSGEIGEAITVPAFNSGLFAAAKHAGVLGIYAGNDHLNSYAGTYYDVELGALASLGYDGYGFGGSFDTNNRLRGGRVVELNLADLSAVTSRMVYAADHGVGR